jgi:uncharacterized protein (DUF362 family)
VFVKPNIVAWTKAVVFPKFGVITTSRVIEDIVRLLKEHGVDDITIGEGTAMIKPKDTETPGPMPLNTLDTTSLKSGTASRR